MKMLFIVLVGLFACARTQGVYPKEQHPHWSGTWEDYAVEATEVIDPNGVCHDLTITLTLQPGLHIRETVSWVQGVNYRCDENYLDYIRFRGVERVPRSITEDILYAYFFIRGAR